jgi:hypothetical protein
MEPNLIGFAMAAVGVIVTVSVAVGFPSLAVVAVRFFKFKERELTLEMESRQKSQHQLVALEERVQRLEDALTSLDHDVRVRLGIDGSATPLSSRPDLVEGPATPDAQRDTSLDPSRMNVR